ncbi:glycosyl hydrolases family 18 domain-containing protein [Ditylenchus destructor]|nr:glycosyl hydrolases family 18 domain-containing protein [Ditylenchus destructor]
MIVKSFRYDAGKLAGDKVITQWTKSGVKRERIVLRLAAYGLAKPLPGGLVVDQQKRTLRGDVPEIDPLSQQEVCEMLKTAKGDLTMLYQPVVIYATTATEAVTFENPQTIGFKTKYAIREGLGGVGLLSLNQDDFANMCKKGSYSLLKAIDEAKCKPESQPIVKKL